MTSSVLCSEYFEENGHKYRVDAVDVPNGFSFQFWIFQDQDVKSSEDWTLETSFDYIDQYVFTPAKLAAVHKLSTRLLKVTPFV